MAESFIPQTSVDPAASTDPAEQPGLTYRIDLETGRIVGMVDGIESVKQAVFLALASERFQHGIYSDDYGIDLSEVIGGGQAFVKTELPRRIRDALVQDDRISDVTNFVFKFDGDAATVEFTVVSTLGEFRQPFSIPQ